MHLYVALGSDNAHREQYQGGGGVLTVVLYARQRPFLQDPLALQHNLTVSQENVHNTKRTSSVTSYLTIPALSSGDSYSYQPLFP